LTQGLCQNRCPERRALACPP